MKQFASVLLVQDDQYVLQHRDDIQTIADPGTYSLWGGAMEDKETPEQGALRELLEETCLDLSEDRLRHLCSTRVTGYGPTSFGDPVVEHIFVAEISPETTLTVREGQGLVKLSKYTELHQNLTQTAKEAIEIYETAAR